MKRTVIIAFLVAQVLTTRAYGRSCAAPQSAPPFPSLPLLGVSTWNPFREKDQAPGKAGALLGTYLIVNYGDSQPLSSVSIDVVLVPPSPGAPAITNLRIFNKLSYRQIGKTIRTPAMGRNHFAIRDELVIGPGHTGVEIEVYGDRSGDTIGDYTTFIPKNGIKMRGATSKCRATAPESLMGELNTPGNDHVEVGDNPRLQNYRLAYHTRAGRPLSFDIAVSTHFARRYDEVAGYQQVDTASLLISYLPRGAHVDRLGDINGNGRVDATDQSIFDQYLAGLLTLSERQLNLADLNRDGMANTIDQQNFRFVIVDTLPGLFWTRTWIFFWSPDAQQIGHYGIEFATESDNVPLTYHGAAITVSP